jgi:hypothetical protein
MSKEVEIYLSGYGYEITQGEFSDEELTKLYQHCEDNNKELDDILFDDLSEILEDRYEWYECDDIIHSYGLDDSNYTIYLNGEGHDHEEVDSDEVKFENEEAGVINPTKKPVITFVSIEKGTMKQGFITLEDDEEFDPTQLTLISTEIFTPDDFYCIITGMRYKEEELNDDFGDTTGKGFEYKIYDPNNIKEKFLKPNESKI